MFTLKYMMAFCLTLTTIVLLSAGGSQGSSARQFYTKRFDSLAGFDFIQICLNNCSQCKKIIGDYFQVQNCAEACLQFRGKSIPNCEDINSVVLE